MQPVENHLHVCNHCLPPSGSDETVHSGNPTASGYAVSQEEEFLGQHMVMTPAETLTHAPADTVTR